MREFTPKFSNNNKVFTKFFLSRYIYILVIGVCLLFGVSYSLTFFIQNKNIATGSLTTGNLTITFTDGNINVTGLRVPSTDQDGLHIFSKSMVINNTADVAGIVELTLERTSGISLSDMKYALLVNGAIVEINTIPANGKILSTAIMGHETLDVEIKLWPKTTYSGGENAFVGEISYEIKYFGQTAADNDDLAGKYVSFNCNGNNCETWRIVKVEDGRLVITRESDYAGATSRVNSNRYNTSLSFNDDSLIFSVSTDNKNVYLLRTVKIDGGEGTISNPYTLTNSILAEPDKKVISVITYVYEDNTEIAKQKIYANQTNYISQMVGPYFVEWLDGNTSYDVGDIVNFNTDKTLVLHRDVWAHQLSYSNSVSGFNCADVQCALESLYELEDEY